MRALIYGGSGYEERGEGRAGLGSSRYSGIDWEVRRFGLVVSSDRV